jgi:hypothetical protein
VLLFNEITFNNCVEKKSIKNKQAKREQIPVEWKVKEMRDSTSKIKRNL